MYLNYMTTNPVAMARDYFTRQIRQMMSERKDFNANIRPVLSRLAKLPSWSDLRAISTFDKAIYIYLKEDQKASTLPREIAQAFGAKGIKSPSSDAIGVTYTIGALTVRVEGYLPASCHLVTEQVLVPARLETVTKVVCKDPDNA